MLAVGDGPGARRVATRRSGRPPVQLVPSRDVAPLAPVPVGFSGLPLVPGKRVADGFFLCLSSAWTCENRRRRRLRRRPWLFGVKPPVVLNGRLSGMFQGDIACLKALYRGRSYLGGPEYIRSYCGAFYWWDEQATHLSVFPESRMFFNRCCKGGKVDVPTRSAWPSPLDRLIRFGGGAESREFMRLIRSYNNMFAFCSLGVKVDDSINTGRGPYVFKVNGLPCHRIGSLVPAPEKPPKFVQLYIYDTANNSMLALGAL